MPELKLKFDKAALRKLEENLKMTLTAAQEGGIMGLVKHSEEVIKKSQGQVPTDSGTLRDSAFIDEPVVDEGDEIIRVRLGYGGVADKKNPRTGQMASEYMVYVHENLSATHPTGKAKFLEDPVMESAPELGAKVAMEVRDKFARVRIRR